MTTNQTIDGVPRKSLEQALKLAAVFDDGGDGADAESARGVVWILRALLDAPAVSLADEGEKPAAQPQGEQVVCDHGIRPPHACDQCEAQNVVPDYWEDPDTGTCIDQWTKVRGLNGTEAYSVPLYRHGEQPAPLAVAHQYRQRPLWRKDDNSGWMPWQDCSQEAHADYTASPDLHDWQYETRTLYAGPNQQ